MQTNPNTEAKTAKNGGSVSLTANLNIIKSASELLRSALIEYGEFGIIEKTASLGASLSCLTMAVRKAQGGNLNELEELNIDHLTDELCELPIFIASLARVMGSVDYLQHAISREIAE